MALAPSAYLLPTGRLAPDLVPRTPDEVGAYAEDGSGYATDTAKTLAYVAAFGAEADADTRVAALSGAPRDGAARAYVYWRSYEARADALALMPRSGSAEGAGSYSYDVRQVADARALADAFRVDFEGAVSDPDDADDYAAWPRARSVR